MRLVLAAAAVLLVAGCSRAPAPGSDEEAKLQKGIDAARYLTSTRHLRRSTYAAIREQGTPTELVSFLFSDLGVAEWPPTDTMPDQDRARARAINVPVLASDVRLVYGVPNPRLRAQVVLYGDDTQGEIVAVAYADPDKPPVLAARWPMPEMKPVKAK